MLTLAILSDNAAGVIGTFGLAGLSAYCAWKYGYKRGARDPAVMLGAFAVFLVIGGFLAMGAEG